MANNLEFLGHFNLICTLFENHAIDLDDDLRYHLSNLVNDCYRAGQRSERSKPTKQEKIDAVMSRYQNG